MPFRVLVMRSLLVLLCCSLIIPWNSFAPSALAEDAGPHATPVVDVVDETPAPEPDASGEPDAVTPEPVVPGVLPEPTEEQEIAPEDSTPAPQSGPGTAADSTVGTLAVNESTLTASVSMANGGVIPPGITLSGSWDGHTDRIPVPAGATQVDVTFPNLIPYGDYELMLSTTSFSRRVVINLDSPVESFQAVVPALFASATVTLRTSDNGVIPAGTRWALKHGDTTVLNGVLDAPMISGTSFTIGPAYTNSYELTLTPPEDGVGRQFQEQSVSVVLYSAAANNWSMDLEIQEALAAVNVSVTMQDGGNIPAGLQWSLLPVDSWDPIATGPVTAGSPSFSHDIPEQVPYGSYQLWITGNGYSSGQTISAQSATVEHGFTLTRLTGTLDLTLNTSDSGDVPDGTIFELMRGSTVVSSFIVDASVTNGTVHSLGTFDFGVYELKVSPPVDSPDRQVVPQTTTINMTNSLVTEYNIDVNLEVFTPMSTVTVSVEMTDDGLIPMGLEWSLLPYDSWDPIATGPVTAGGTTFFHDIPEQVPYGVYQLWITGNGYSSGQVINVQSDTFHHGFTIERLYGNLAITVTTNDGSDIPAGTMWEIRDANDVVIQSGTLVNGLPNGGVLDVPNPLEFGIYTLHIGPPTDMLVPMALGDLPRDLLPYSTTLNITNPWVSQYPVAAELQWAQSDVTFSVSMSDGGPLPNGLDWMLVVSGSWDPLATGTVTAGEITFAGQVLEPVPFGVFELWINGNGYSSGQVLNIGSFTTHHDFVLDRLQADVTVTLDTSDDADIPAGTAWSIVDSAGNPVQSGVLTDALIDGSALPLTNPFAFDVYTLVVEADGYHPVTMELAVTNPWLSEIDVTVNLVSDRLPEPIPTEPSTPTPAPSPSPSPAPSPSPEPTPATPQPATPAPDSSADVTPAAPVTGLPQTGAGESGMAVVSLLLLVGSLIALAAGFFLRERYRNSN